MGPVADRVIDPHTYIKDGVLHFELVFRPSEEDIYDGTPRDVLFLGPGGADFPKAVYDTFYVLEYEETAIGYALDLTTGELVRE